LAIYGFGSSAHLILQIALWHGCQVYVVSRAARHLELARRMGATWAGTSAAQMPAKVDSGIIFAPAGELVPQALEQIDRGGTLSLADIYMTPVPQMDYARHLFYERDVRSVTANTRADGRELMEIAARAPIRAHVVTYPLRDANRVLADVKADKIEGTAVLIVDDA